MGTETAIRVGIIGCGYQGGMMVRAIARTSSFKVTACADVDQSAAARTAMLAGGATVYPSIEAMLEQDDVDAVVIATSHDALYETALPALRAGKAVLSEKPIAINETEAAHLEAVAQETGTCFMSGYSFRYFAAWQKVHQLLSDDAIGELVSLVGSIGVTPISTGWLANPHMGGGPLLYVGSHLVDQMLWLAQDDPVAVTATVRYRVDMQIDETTDFQLQFASGVIAQGMVTQTATGFFSYLDLYGRKGRIRLHSREMQFTIEVVSQSLSAFTQPTTIHFPEVEDSRILMHLPQLADFAEAIRNSRQPAITVTDGRRVLKVLDAIVKSARIAEPVSIE